LEGVLGDLSRTVTDVSTGFGGDLGRTLRADLTPAHLETSIRASVEGAREAVGPLNPPAPRWWWGLVGAVQLVLFAVLVAGIVWLWVDGVDRNQVPWSLIMIGGSALLAALLGWGTRASGRRSGRQNAAGYRSDVESAIADQLRGRIGAPVSEALAKQERLRTAVAELGIVVADVVL
jgi:hypothetical protein